MHIPVVCGPDVLDLFCKSAARGLNDSVVMLAFGQNQFLQHLISY